MNVFVIVIAVGVVIVRLSSRKPTNPPNCNDHFEDCCWWEPESDDMTEYFESIGIRFKSQ